MRGVRGTVSAHPFADRLLVGASDSRSPSRAKRSMRTEKGGLSTKQSVAVLKPVSDVTDAIETSAKCADLPPIATSSEAPASAPGSDSPNTLNSKTQSRIKGGQLDIYLTREALVQKYLFAAVTGNGTERRFFGACGVR